ncbi:MAG: IS1595 family transposase [Gammaproteobacteria bacterium]|nr:IS1595 family transposase [Gammaproteobacteria bacterium]MYG68304.1 IS1595 family transposase [Gammaproteobacteria bacterium]
MSNKKRKALKAEGAGRGPVGKTVVVGVKDRDTNEVRAKLVTRTDADTLQGFVVDNTAEDSIVYTDEARAYDSLPREHEAVRHGVSEYVRGQAHINGVESFWSLMKRGYFGIYHKMSPKHLDRYVREFQHRHNVRQSDTRDQMGDVVRGMIGKRLEYRNLIADNGLDSGAKPLRPGY